MRVTFDVAARARGATAWLSTHPVAVINLMFLAIVLILFVYFVTKPIDVLANWTVKTTKQEYAPGSTLEFVSTSVKLVSAEGQTSRTFDCDEVGGQTAREIQLPSVPANRAPGYNPPRENSIQVPGVTAFNGLPRTCRIVFNVCYENVILWRDHCETASTNDFHVRETDLDASDIRRELEELRLRQIELEDKLVTYENMKPPTSTTVVQRERIVASNPSAPQVIVQPNPLVSPAPSTTTTPSPAATPRPCVIGLLGLCILGAR